MTDVFLALVSASVGAVVALWTSERQLRLANVTAERAVWRERIRGLAGDLATSADDGDARLRAAVGIQLSTNPFDELDREIVELAMRIAKAQKPDDEDLSRVMLRLQLLLKHDWERAKLEAGWGGAIAAWSRKLLGRGPSPARPDFARSVAWRERHALDLDLRLPPA